MAEHHTTHHATKQSAEPKGDEVITQSTHWDKPNPQPKVLGVHIPVTAEEKDIHNYLGAEEYAKLKEGQKKMHDEAIQRKIELDEKKNDADLKRLGVKRWEDETKKKPDYICVEKGCGEPKAPGQGFVCASHARYS